MRYDWDEIEQLAAILRAEAAGHPIAAGEGRRLASLIAQSCPDIAVSMHRVMRRMEQYQDVAA